MKQFELNYLKKFKCIADKCQNSCCKGWVVGIDKKSIKSYKKLQKKDVRFCNYIDYKNKSFILDENKRCPFLNKNGLCDLITDYGENSLCQVCSDHPRFRSFIGDRVETGLGLSCEQAVNVVLQFDDKICPISIDGKKSVLSGFNRELFEVRNEIIKILYDSSTGFLEKVKKVAKYIGTDLKYLDGKRFLSDLLNLEYVDKKWQTFLEEFYSREDVFYKLSKDFEWYLTQFIVNLIYRHLSMARDKTDIKIRTSFCLLTTNIVVEISGSLSYNKEELFSLVRLISQEVEYSDKNIEKLYCAIEEKVPLYL